MKNVLVTGTTRGLGKELAIRLAKNGYRVYAANRSAYKPENPSIVPIYLDLIDEQSIQDAVAKIGPVDIVVHNAGLAYWGATEAMTGEEVRTLYQTNVFGPWALTQCLLPRMRRKRSGHIIFVSSVIGIENCAYMGMYAGSKAAIEALAHDLAVTTRRWGIRVNVIQPGPMSTNIPLHHGKKFDTVKNPYLPYPEYHLDYQSPTEVADIILEVVRQEQRDFLIQTSPMVREVVSRRRKDITGNCWINEGLKDIQRDQDKNSDG